jgi:phosphatidylglycerophosphate synthase
MGKLLAVHYSYSASIKSDVSDEPVNVYLQRPIAGLVVRLVFNTPVTPNQLTFISTIFGMLGAAAIIFAPLHLWAAGILLYAKDIFDSADGQLARAKMMHSRRGRFYDSIGDFIVDACVFSAVAFWVFTQGYPLPISVCIGLAGLLGVSLRVSYHVFYQSSFLHTEEKYSMNRVSEEIFAGDLQEDRVTRLLHRMFLFLYGWQDRLMRHIDLWCYQAPGRRIGMPDKSWYQNATALRFGGFLGLGTEYVLLATCLFADSLWTYLFCTLVLLNLLWGAAILYHRWEKT